MNRKKYIEGGSDGVRRRVREGVMGEKGSDG